MRNNGKIQEASVELEAERIRPTCKAKIDYPLICYQWVVSCAGDVGLFVTRNGGGVEALGGWRIVSTGQAKWHFSIYKGWVHLGLYSPAALLLLQLRQQHLLNSMMLLDGHQKNIIQMINNPPVGRSDGSAPQSGFVWDGASGYYYDATSGFYYDGNTGFGEVVNAATKTMEIKDTSVRDTTTEVTTTVVWMVASSKY
ncbi:hypothetical protein NE237_027722 [Protea cynaroides]|uniref:OCRE domain-containing protein n=1 Tax=Protea cynaroides TaxID=273540 RepID=A0A9Q0GR14_9MAGN|nr:hypothetical protein NE237_027722 [Protea cynaroides]